MRRFLSSAVLGTALLAGCATGWQRGGETGFGSLKPAPYRLPLQFDSKIPDPYVLTTVTGGAYQRHDVNKQFKELLENYATEKSRAASGQPAALLITAEGLTTTYDRVGGGRYERPTIRRSAKLALTAELRIGEKTLAREAFTVEADETVTPTAETHQAYSYTGVLRSAEDRAIARIDKFVDQTFGP